MKYDLTNKLHRKQFVKRCNDMLKKGCKCVELIDQSKRSLNQNAYLHVLIRILALETGVTETYAKQVYFKQLANPDLFIAEKTDEVSGVKVSYLRSTSELTAQEMSKAINSFRHWSEDNGYYLPEASLEDDGSMSFASDNDAEAFHQAEIETSRMEQYL